MPLSYRNFLQISEELNEHKKLKTLIQHHTVKAEILKKGGMEQHIVLLLQTCFRSRDKLHLTYNHNSEFKSFLDTLAKNLIRKICKTHVAFHSFCTLYNKMKTEAVIQTRFNTNRIGLENDRIILSSATHRFQREGQFFDRGHCRKTQWLQRREGRKQVEISVCTS